MNAVSTQVFNYNDLDVSTADFLRQKESNMREIVGKAYTDLGRELKEAQEALAKQGSKYDGIFEQWYTCLGWKKRTVYNLIDRFNLVQNLHEVSEIERVEDLPVSLTYEIAKPSAESTPAKAQAKAEVLNGEIDTLKKYKERIAELEAQAQQAESARRQAEQRAAEAKRSEELAMIQLERAEEQLATATKPKEIIVEKPVEKVVTIDNTDYKAVERLKAYEERFGALENYSERVRASNVDTVTTSIVSFNMAVRDFIKRHAYLLKYQDTIQFIDKVTQREYNEAVQALKEISAEFCKVSGIGDYVDVEFSEVNN